MTIEYGSAPPHARPVVNSLGALARRAQAAALLASCGVLLICTVALAQTDSSVAHAPLWPRLRAGVPLDPKIERFIDSVLRQMTLEEKVGQMLQADVSTASPEDVRRFGLGSVLAGGNSAPKRDLRGPPQDWLELARSYAPQTPAGAGDDRPVVPPLFGIDAVHGHGHARGATIFPHNIGLGAAHDPRLVQRIGEATAAEVAATGVDWVFAPTVAVAQDPRWGRTYESYSSDPALVASYAAAMVSGLQGTRSGGRLAANGAIATLKHFLGDGATRDGRDQGESVADELELRDVHGAGYVGGLPAGALTVMVSYSSWRGTKMHGNGSLLTDVLKDRLGFNGFVIGDWNGHDQVPGCTKFDCPAAVLAGVDMFMAADGWQRFRDNTLAEVRSGAIPAARIDDAVRRILRVKALAGLFAQGNAAQRHAVWDAGAIGAPAHRALAREAVSRSLVLLKNDRHVLPLAAGSRLLVAGPAADDIGQQCGGWTVDWQGDHNQNADFPGATSIYAGIREAVYRAGGTVQYSADGTFAVRPDAALVVFGERPYAEFDGDRELLRLGPQDAPGLEMMRKLRSQGIPVIAVLLTGRPLWMNRELNAADAFVVAWLPGSEGAGVADVLVGDVHGRPRREFSGRLPFDWPATPKPVHRGEDGSVSGALYQRGFGLVYQSRVTTAHLDEDDGPAALAGTGEPLFTAQHVVAPWSIFLQDQIGDLRDTMRDVDSEGHVVNVALVDDGMAVRWRRDEGAELLIAGRARDLSDATRPGAALAVTYRVDSPPSAPVWLGLRCGLPYGAPPEVPAANARRCGLDGPGAMLDVTDSLRARPGAWNTLVVPLRCFAGAQLRYVGAPFALKTEGRVAVTFTDIRIIDADAAEPDCSARPAPRADHAAGAH